MKKINLKTIKKVILLVILLALLIGLFFIIRVAIKLDNLQKEAVSMINMLGEDAFYENKVTSIYDANGQLICELNGSEKTYYLKSDEIPRSVKEAFLVTEDRSFYEHSGIDYKAVVRAFLALVENEGEITQGGSTITQQLARNIYLTHEVSVERKVKEMFIAMELEKKYTKDEILEFYINNIYFGNGYYGIGAASKGYFNKEVKELELWEVAFLCSIPNNPTKYDPYENFENTLDRKDRILYQMFNEGYIDGNTYNEALYGDIVLGSQELVKHNYVETYARYCATKALMKANGFIFKYSFDNLEDKEAYEKAYEEMYGYYNELLFVNGYEIYTSIDLNVQENLQNSVDLILSTDTNVNEEGIYKLQGSATCIDNSTGYVVAIVGGREQEYEGYTLNRAYQSYRQPGSAIKPILVYTPAFEKGYTPETKILDEEVADGPDNYYNYYMGELSVRRAVEISVNTIPWKILGELGIGNGLAYLKSMEFGKIDARDYVPAVSIGGMTYGVSSLEMAAAYATIENDGIYRDVTCIRKIIGYDDNVIVDNGANENNTKRVYDMNASRMMTDVLKGVMINGTGTSYELSNAISAGKTGTTNNNYDVWMVGYTSYYTTAVWCGYDMPENLSEKGYTKFAGYIWNDFMEKMHEDKAIADFVPYTKVESTKDEVESETEVETETTSEDTEETTLYEEITDGNGMGSYEEETTSYQFYEDEADSNGTYEEENEIETESIGEN